MKLHEWKYALVSVLMIGGVYALYKTLQLAEMAVRHVV